MRYCQNLKHGIFAEKKAFTLLEVMVVIIVLGILATIAIPNYRKTIDRSRLQDAMQQLTALHAANMIFRSQQGTGYLVAAPSITYAPINSNLGINIIPNGLTYTYGGSATTFEAKAQYGPDYTVTVTHAVISATNPACSGGDACP